MKTLKMIIADDEYIVLNGLKNILDWVSLGVEIIGEAKTGEELEKQILEKRPDIVISDICMSGKTGLEVLKNISEQEIATSFVFLSGYSNFSYAREAIKYHAVDYLLKPVDENALKEVIVSIRKGREADEKDTSSSGKFYDNDKMFSVLVIRPKVGGNRRIVLDYLIQKNYDAFISKGDVCVIFSRESEEISHLTEMKKLFYKLLNDLSVDLVGACGKEFNGISRIIESYNDALISIQYSYFFDESRLYQRDDITLFINHKKYDLKQCLASLTSAVEACDIPKMNEAVDQMSETIMCESLGKKDVAIMKLFSVIDFVRHSINNNVFKDFYNHDVALNALNATEKYGEAVRYLKDFLCEYFGLFQNNHTENKKNIIRDIKKYIEDHLSEDITLESVSKMVYMNMYYLSVYFKKHTNMNFKDYVLKIKMEKALYYIKETNAKIYEISDMLNFCDQKHFSKMFKKYYNITPTALRNSLNKK